MEDPNLVYCEEFFMADLDESRGSEADTLNENNGGSSPMERMVIGRWCLVGADDLDVVVSHLCLLGLKSPGGLDAKILAMSLNGAPR